MPKSKPYRLHPEAWMELEAGCPTFRGFRNVGFHDLIGLEIFLLEQKQEPAVNH